MTQQAYEAFNLYWKSHDLIGEGEDESGYYENYKDTFHENKNVGLDELREILRHIDEYAADHDGRCHAKVLAIVDAATQEIYSKQWIQYEPQEEALTVWQK